VCVCALEAAKVVDVPSPIVVVPTAIRAKITSVLPVVFKLLSEQRYSLYKLGVS